MYEFIENLSIVIYFPLTLVLVGTLFLNAVLPRLFRFSRDEAEAARTGLSTYSNLFMFGIVIAWTITDIPYLILLAGILFPLGEQVHELRKTLVVYYKRAPKET